jgi:oxalate decarboxylase/phosphoglucose isomerase-like protein (cupin superfamily)
MSDTGTLAEVLDRHLKTYDTRQPNWRVFGLETELDEKFARAQRRYLGTSGNVAHDDPTALMGAHFTLTIIQQPAGHLQPMHHHDEEEVFFVLRGNPTVVWQRDGETIERRLAPWDMVYNPPGMVHGVRNDSDEDAYFQVMLGNPAPDRPKYQDPELLRLQQADRPDTETRQA